MDRNTMLKVINGMADKIEALEDKIDDLYIYSPKSDMCQRISDLEAKNYQLKSEIDALKNEEETLTKAEQE